MENCEDGSNYSLRPECVWCAVHGGAFKQSRSAFGAFTDSSNDVTITGLKPETSYELKLLAINGKGESESSPAEFFKTEPVRKCTVSLTL